MDPSVTWSTDGHVTDVTHVSQTVIYQEPWVKPHRMWREWVKRAEEGGWGWGLWTDMLMYWTFFNGALHTHTHRHLQHPVSDDEQGERLVMPLNDAGGV